jgi:hypothetical protein
MIEGRERQPDPADGGEADDQDALDFSVVDIPILTEVLEPIPDREPGKPDPDPQQPL